MPAPTRVTLARLSHPPDTSQLQPCGEAETASAIHALVARLSARRALLAAKGVVGAPLERVLSALRRVRGPGLAAYRVPAGLVLSEPFGLQPSVITRAPQFAARELLAGMLGRQPPGILVDALATFGTCALRRAADAKIRIAVVPAGRPFSQCSRRVASLVPDIDRWQAPPAGLFVLEERLVLLRPNALRMAAAHEFAHALDSVLAVRPRSYFSFECEAVREAFASAPAFVNEYAASGLDEYFAESVRAYTEVNDDRSVWLPLTRYELARRDPKMFAIIEKLMGGLRCGKPCRCSADALTN